jgi:inner membrane protein
MDNLTHSMFGLVLARAGLARVAPRATVVLLLAANAPDIDVLAWAGGSLAYLRHHRGVSHALPGLPLVAGLVVVVMWLLRGRRGRFPWWRTYLVALAGVASHIAMDFSNLYGVRPWLPFSPRWYSWDILFIVDAWLWAALLVCLAAPSLGRLVSAEIGAPTGTGRAAAVLALLFTVAWYGARDVFHRRAVAVLEARLYGPDSAPRPPLRVAAFPTPASPLLWRGFVETESFYRMIPVHVFRAVEPDAGEILYKPEDTPVLEAARRARTAADFLAFARYAFAVVQPQEDGHRVVFSDFRFRGERRSAFLCTIVLDKDLRILEERFAF